jgi:hypothetical protein
MVLMETIFPLSKQDNKSCVSKERDAAAMQEAMELSCISPVFASQYHRQLAFLSNQLKPCVDASNSIAVQEAIGIMSQYVVGDEAIAHQLLPASVPSSTSSTNVVVGNTRRSDPVPARCLYPIMGPTGRLNSHQVLGLEDDVLVDPQRNTDDNNNNNNNNTRPRSWPSTTNSSQDNSRFKPGGGKARDREPDIMERSTRS